MVPSLVLSEQGGTGLKLLGAILLPGDAIKIHLPVQQGPCSVGRCKQGGRETRAAAHALLLSGLHETLELKAEKRFFPRFPLLATQPLDQPHLQRSPQFWSATGLSTAPLKTKSRSGSPASPNPPAAHPSPNSLTLPPQISLILPASSSSVAKPQAQPP